MAKIIALPQGQDADLSVGAKGVDNGTAVTFTIYKASDDTELDTVDGTIEKGRAKCVWPTKGLEPDDEGDERELRIYFKAVPDGTDAAIVSPEMIVYLDFVEVTTVLEDGGVAKDIPVRVHVGEGRRRKTIKRSTDGSGLLKVQALPRGKVEVEFPSPVRFLDWSEAPKTAKFKAKVRPAFKVEVVWPLGEETDKDGNAELFIDEDADPLHRQWVNLTRSRSKPEQSHTCRVKVKVVEADGPGKKGDVIFCKLEYPEKAKLSKRKARRGFAKGKRLTKAVRLRKDDGEAIFQISLGLAGGDSVKVRVGGTEACEDAAFTIVNWRKLYYKVIHPDCVTVPDPLAHLDAKLEEAFVVYERLETERFAKADLPARGQHAHISGAEFTGDSGDAGNYWIAGEHNIRWCRTKFNKTKGRRGMNMIVASAYYDCGTRRAPKITKTKTLTRRAAWIPLKKNDCEVFPAHPLTGEKCLVRGSWRSLAPRGHPHRKHKGKLEEGVVVVNRQSEGRRNAVGVVFPEDHKAAEIVGDGKKATPDQDSKDVKYPIKVTVTVIYAKGPWLGYSVPGSSETLSVRSPGDKAFQETVLHELGHNMKQAVFSRRPYRDNRPPRGMKLGDHGETYKEKGHQGPHCYHGLDDQATHIAHYDGDGNELAPRRIPRGKLPHTYPDYRDLYTDVNLTSAWGTCTLYGAGPEDDVSLLSDGFCEACQQFVKGQSLTRLW